MNHLCCGDPRWRLLHLARVARCTQQPMVDRQSWLEEEALCPVMNITARHVIAYSRFT
jgi:hypothetical protein